MGRWQSKPTDLQRGVLLAAGDADPDKRVVGAQYAQAAKLLAERGYIVLHPHGGGFRVELSDLAMRKYCRHTKHGLWTNIHTWRRFPPLGPQVKITMPFEEMANQPSNNFERLLAWLMTRWTKGTITARELQRHGPRPLRENRRDITPLTELLVRRGYLVPNEPRRCNIREWRIIRKGEVV